MLIVLDEFILVGEYAVATIDIAPGEWLRSLLKDRVCWTKEAMPADAELSERSMPSKH